MFSEMVAGLEQGRLPEFGPLRGRCHAAITKKLALLRLPPLYWESDPKRNPNTAHLLWAVLLLEDAPMFELVYGIVLMEQEEGAGLSYQDFLEQSLAGIFPEIKSGTGEPSLRSHLLAASRSALGG